MCFVDDPPWKQRVQHSSWKSINLEDAGNFLFRGLKGLLSGTGFAKKHRPHNYSILCICPKNGSQNDKKKRDTPSKTFFRNFKMDFWKRIFLFKKGWFSGCLAGYFLGEYWEDWFVLWNVQISIGFFQGTNPKTFQKGEKKAIGKKMGGKHPVRVC